MKQNVHIVLLIVWIVIILVLTGYPDLKISKMPAFPIDKLYHFVLFFVLGALQYRVLKKYYFFVLGIGITLVSEFQQFFVPGRDFEVLDIIAGLVGLVAAYLVFTWGKFLRHEISET